MAESSNGHVEIELSRSSLLTDNNDEHHSSLFEDAYNGVSKYIKENPFKTGALVAVAATSGIGLLVLTRKRLPEAIDSMSAGGIKDILTSSLRATGADTLSSATQQRLSAARETYAGKLINLWTLPKSVPVKPGEDLLGFTERVFTERAAITGETVATQAIASEAQRIARLNGIFTTSEISGKTLNVMSPDYFSRIAKFMQRKQLSMFDQPDLLKPELSSLRQRFQFISGGA